MRTFKWKLNRGILWHFIITVQLYYWSSKNPSVKIWSNKFQMVMINQSKLCAKFIGKSNERILCKRSKSEILRLYSNVHVAMETTKTSNFTCQSKFFITIFSTWQVCELQPFSCHEASDIYSQTAKTVCSHLKCRRKTLLLVEESWKWDQKSICLEVSLA